MGEIIVRKVRSMNWKAKISLVLIFTLVFSTFMYQGFYKPKAAHATLPAVRNVGTVASGTNAITPGMPGSVLKGDILLLFIETADQAVTVSGGTETWTAMPGSPVTGATGIRLAVLTYILAVSVCSAMQSVRSIPTRIRPGRAWTGYIIRSRVGVAQG